MWGAIHNLSNGDILKMVHYKNFKDFLLNGFSSEQLYSLACQNEEEKVRIAIVKHENVNEQTLTRLSTDLNANVRIAVLQSDKTSLQIVSNCFDSKLSQKKLIFTLSNNLTAAGVSLTTIKFMVKLNLMDQYKFLVGNFVQYSQDERVLEYLIFHTPAAVSTLAKQSLSCNKNVSIKFYQKVLLSIDNINNILDYYIINNLLKDERMPVEFIVEYFLPYQQKLQANMLKMKPGIVIPSLEFFPSLGVYPGDYFPAIYNLISLTLFKTKLVETQTYLSKKFDVEPTFPLPWFAKTLGLPYEF